MGEISLTGVMAMFNASDPDMNFFHVTEGWLNVHGPTNSVWDIFSKHDCDHLQNLLANFVTRTYSGNSESRKEFKQIAFTRSDGVVCSSSVILRLTPEVPFNWDSLEPVFAVALVFKDIRPLEPEQKSEQLMTTR